MLLKKNFVFFYLHFNYSLFFVFITENIYVYVRNVRINNNLFQGKIKYVTNNLEIYNLYFEYLPLYLIFIYNSSYIRIY